MMATSDGQMDLSAAALRARFKAIPGDERNANQDFCIRIWRATSWLARAEAAPPDDLEGRFIPLWIAFNSLYGRMEGSDAMAPDHAGWQAFLSQAFLADGYDRIGKALGANRLNALRMIESPYLFKPFWLGEADHAEGALNRARQQALLAYNKFEHLPVLQALFERVYVLRQQIFHGAATAGSRENRRTLKMGVEVLAAIVPVLIAIVIESGPAADWGRVCYPPADREGPRT